MTRELRQVMDTVEITNKAESEQLVCEDCNCSVYTMATVAGCLLLCIGIVVYALLCA